MLKLRGENAEDKFIKQVQQAQKENSQEFPATGIASNDGKAVGSIIVYNKLTSAFTIFLSVYQQGLYMSDLNREICFERMSKKISKYVSCPE